MSNLMFVSFLGIFFAVLFYWGFRRLPAEEWQIMATVPSRQSQDGSWQGINLTYYGFFNASACVLSCAVIVLLMSSIGVPVVATLLVIGALLVVCVPAARIVAHFVEGKGSTFTVGGASFIGILFLPWLIKLFNSVGPRYSLTVPIVQMLAAAAIAYAFGEAFGRLACISFGCCYGKVLWHAPMLVQKTLRNFCFVFTGATKKVAYEGEMMGMPLVPIQAVTAIVCSLAGLVGVFFFLRSAWIVAAIVPITITQVWRILSETLRADYRGGGTFSAYQIMALASLVYSLTLLSQVTAAVTDVPSVIEGVKALASAPMLVLLQSLWITIFVYLGRSSVTAARISFHVVRDRI